MTGDLVRGWDITVGVPAVFAHLSKCCQIWLLVHTLLNLIYQQDSCLWHVVPDYLVGNVAITECRSDNVATLIDAVRVLFRKHPTYVKTQYMYFSFLINTIKYNMYTLIKWDYKQNPAPAVTPFVTAIGQIGVHARPLAACVQQQQQLFSWHKTAAVTPSCSWWCVALPLQAPLLLLPLPSRTDQ